MEQPEACGGIVFGKRGSHVGDVALHSMGDGIHTCGCSDRDRHGAGELGIADHFGSDDLVIDNDIFDDFFGVDEGTDVGDLAGSSCGGRDGDEGKKIILDHVHSAVSADRSFVGHQYVDCLGKVDTASAADSDKNISFGFECEGCRLLHHFVGGVRDNTVKDNGFGAGLFDLGENDVGDSRGLHTAVIDKKDFFCFIILKHLGELGDGSAAEFDITFYKEIVAHMRLLLYVVRRFPGF